MVTQGEDICSECGALLSLSCRHCPTCRADAGAPNVRDCLRKENSEALTARFTEATARASAKGCSKEFATLLQLVDQKSGVVVSVPPGIARSLVDNPEFLYTNYERLVAANARKHANPEDDRRRCAVGGSLFGSFAENIVYGALSLTEEGISTYGAVHCRLRSVAIKKRTSFLETNSSKFFQDHRIVIGDALPVGYRAAWEHRQRLVLAKLADSLSVGQTESDWQAILIHSDRNNRNNDDYVEAHIYESFDINAIESMVAALGIRTSRAEKIDIDVAIGYFKRLGGKKK